MTAGSVSFGSVAGGSVGLGLVSGGVVSLGFVSGGVVSLGFVSGGTVSLGCVGLGLVSSVGLRSGSACAGAVGFTGSVVAGFVAASTLLSGPFWSWASSVGSSSVGAVGSVSASVCKTDSVGWDSVSASVASGSIWWVMVVVTSSGTASPLWALSRQTHRTRMARASNNAIFFFMMDTSLCNLNQLHDWAIRNATLRHTNFHIPAPPLLHIGRGSPGISPYSVQNPSNGSHDRRSTGHQHPGNGIHRGRPGSCH